MSLIRCPLFLEVGAGFLAEVATGRDVIARGTARAGSQAQ